MLAQAVPPSPQPYLAVLRILEPLVGLKEFVWTSGSLEGGQQVVGRSPLPPNSLLGQTPFLFLLYSLACWWGGGEMARQPGTYL